MHKFSIIVPTFNSEKTLSCTLDSFRGQSWSNLEVIIVDGASTDGTLKVVADYADVVTKVISEPDRGIYDAINKGLDLASGELIGVVGSDDSLCAGALAAIAASVDRAPADIVAGAAILVSPDGGEVLRKDEVFGVGALLSGIPFCHNSMFATAGTYSRVGKYDLKYQICADASWVHRAIRMGCSCSVIDTPIVRFSLSGASSSDAEKIMRETYEIISANFPGLSLVDAEILFRAIRGWSDGSGVEPVLRRYMSNPGVLHSAAIAFFNKGLSVELIDGSAGQEAGKGVVTAGLSRAIGRLKNFF